MLHVQLLRNTGRPGGHQTGALKMRNVIWSLLVVLFPLTAFAGNTQVNANSWKAAERLRRRFPYFYRHTALGGHHGKRQGPHLVAISISVWYLSRLDTQNNPFEQPSTNL